MKLARDRDAGSDEMLDPQIERELEAIDKALAGESVDAELADLAALATDLRAERPTPDEEWGAGVDREMAGKLEPGSGGGWLGGFRERLMSGGLMPLGSVAALLVVAVIVASSGNFSGGGDDAETSALSEDVAIATTETADESVPEAADAGSAGGGSASFEALEDSARDADRGVLESQYPAVAGDIGAANALAAKPKAFSRNDGANGNRIAPGRENRLQDRAAALSLQTTPDDVRRVSDEVIQTTESVGGVVSSSNLNESENRSFAELDLRIPTRELDGTLDKLTDLATVQSLNETVEDITRPFVSAQNDLDDANAEREKLLEALGNAETEEQAESLRIQLKDARKRISRAEARVDNIGRQGRISEVSVTIEGRDGFEEPVEDDGEWGLDDAVDDALTTLEDIAGIALVSLAILGPIGLAIAAIWFVGRKARQRRRESALDE